MRFPVLVLLLLTLSASLLRAQSAVAPGDVARVRVVRSDERGVVLRVEGLRPLLERHDGRLAAALNSPLHSVATDSLTLPRLSLTVAVPHDATGFAVTASDARSTRLALAAPLANGRDAAGSGVSAMKRLRDVAAVTIVHDVLRVEGGSLVADTALTLTLTWRGGSRASAGREALAETPSVDAAMRALVLNYDAARRWRVRAEPMSARLLSAETPGMGEAIVLLVPRDGIYRIGADELIAARASIAGSPLTQLGLQVRGASRPMYVADANGDGLLDAGDAIEFPGERNRGIDGDVYGGDSSRTDYYDGVTDTNAYVLSWDGRAGDPMRIADAALPADAPALREVDSTLHFERENVYFVGMSMPDPKNDGEAGNEWGGDIRTLHVSERVPGERYHWADFNGQGPRQEWIPFDAAPALAPGGSYVLRVRLLNVSAIATPIELLLNDYGMAGAWTLPPRSDTLIEATVPASYLVDGTNTLKLFIKQQPAVVHRVLLDYFELAGRWRTSTTDAAPRFTLPANASPTQPMRVRLNGLPAPVTHAMSARSRVAVDSATTPGLHFRITSRTYYTGSDRVNRGFVAEFGDSVMSSFFFLGLAMAEVDGAGRIIRKDLFNTFDEANGAAELRRAAAFINAAASGSFIVAGSSHGFGPHPLPAELATALTSLGSSVPSRSGQFYAAWAFVARKGDPSSAREEYAELTGPESRGVTLDEWLPSPQGNRYRAVLTVAGSPGEEFVLSSVTTPRLRAHGADELLSADNRGDLIIITHPAFRASAERLAEHRRRHAPADAAGFTVRVVDVNTIYDEFGQGIKHQMPIRRFLQYAYTNWTRSGTAPAYALLFGDASADPQRRMQKSKMIDYVPTFGEPASDYWYTMPFLGRDTERLDRWPYDVGSSFTYFIGRLPAMTPAEAETMVDKIIEYDTAAPAAWNKRFVFVAGGEDATEVETNRQLADELAANYVASPFFQGDTTVRHRRTFPGTPSVPPHPDARWAQEGMAEGGAWVNAAGHGSRTVLDLDFGMPEEIDNGSRYFVLGTFSCQTGAFSEVESSLRNEDFLKAPRRGAIATYGSTGWSYGHLNAATISGVLGLITFESVRALGELTTIAKWRLFGGADATWWQQQYEGFRLRNHVMQYSLLGDPSQEIAISRKRELAFGQPLVSNGSGGMLSVTDTSASVAVEIFNHGRAISSLDAGGDSSITVVATIIGPDRSEAYDTVDVRWLARSQALTLSLPLDGRPGDYTIRIEADPEGRVDEGYRADNVVVLSVPVRGNQPLALEPLAHGRVAGYDDVVIRMLNPPTGPGAVVTLDTVPTFDGAPVTSATLGAVESDDLTTTWRLSIPASMRGATRFWWRAVASSGDPETAERFPLIETFTVDRQQAEFLLGGQRQMAGRTVNLVNGEEGVGPGSRRAKIVVEAIGQTRYLSGDEILGDKIYFGIDDGVAPRRLSNQHRAGLQIAVLDPATLDLVPGQYVNYVFFENGPMIDSAVRFIDAIPAAHPVIVATNGRSFDGLRESDALRAALASLGAQLVVDSIGIEDSFILIGGKGMPARQAWVFGDSLLRARSGGDRYARIALEQEYSVSPTPGVLTTPTIGPATAWRTARLDLTPQGARPDVTIVGVRRDGVRDSLGVAAAATVVDLAFVDVARYPRIELRTRFAQDSTTRLRSIAVDFDPSPELAVVPRSIDTDRDSVLQGDPATLSMTVINLSRQRAADSVSVALAQRSLGEWRELGEQRVTLAPMERREVRFDLVTDRFGSTNHFRALLNPGDEPAEPYRHNNTDTTSMRAGVDTTMPRLAIYADGERIMDGDFVSPTARFELRLTDNSRLRISDTTAITMFLDLVEITVDSGAVFDRVAGGDVRATLAYTPPAPGLDDGEHTITYRARDASGNQTESDYVRFFVERALRITQTVNYPNPFVEKTEFTFRVAGGSQPTGGEIAIYTVAGRRIKSIPLSPADVHLGFNHIEWNGRDEDGDALANGVYLYKVRIDSPDGTAEVIEKLVVMR